MPSPAYTDLSSQPGSESARIGILLGLDEASSVDDVELARCVSRGLMPGSATALQKILGHVLSVDLVPEATLRRAQKNRKPLSRDHSERLYELSRVTDAVSRLFHGDEPSMQAFLNPPSRDAQGRGAALPGAGRFGGVHGGPEPRREGPRGRCRLSRQRPPPSGPRTLEEPLTGRRIGDANGDYPVFSGEGAARVAGRWHDVGQRVIYVATHYSTALLEKLVYSSGILPPGQHEVEVTVPTGCSYEVVNPERLPGWQERSGNAS